MMDFARLRHQFVDNQVRTSEVTDRDLVGAILSIPRELFVCEAERPFAYSDRELLMSAQAPERRMLDPVQLARLLQALPVSAASKVLVVGAGTGYAAALLSRLADRVIALEAHEELAAITSDNLRGVGAANVAVVRGALADGHAAEAPYDAVLVDGAIETLPEALIAQMRPGAQMAAIERDARISRAMLYERVGGGLTKWPLFEAWGALLPGFEKPHSFVF